MSTYEIIAVFLSSAALFFSLLTIAIDIFSAYKNRITAATFTVELNELHVTSVGISDWVHCNLLLTNHTRREFTVGRITVTINGIPCRSWRVVEKPQKLGEPSRLGELRTFRVMPQDIINIDFYIEAPHLEAPASGTLSVMTSYKKIDYPVLIPCDCKDNTDKG